MAPKDSSDDSSDEIWARATANGYQIGACEAQDSLKDRNKHVEHPALARRVHGLDQRLVAVAQIDAAPDRRPLDDLRGPTAINQINRR